MAQDPFDENTLRELVAQEAKLKEASAPVEKAIRGGFDLQQQRQQVTDLQAKLMQIKRTFWPGQ